MLMKLKDIQKNKDLSVKELYKLLKEESNYILKLEYLEYNLEEIDFFTGYDETDKDLREFSMLKMNWSWNGVKTTEELIKKYEEDAEYIESRQGERLAFVKKYADVYDYWCLGGYNNIRSMPKPIICKEDLLKALCFNTEFYLNNVYIKID